MQIVLISSVYKYLNKLIKFLLFWIMKLFDNGLSTAQNGVRTAN